MGMSLYKGGVQFNKAIIYIIVYSFLTPFGILAGRLVLNQVLNNPKILGIIMAIPIGIFIYIAIVEIILEEFVVANNKFLKFFFLLFGVFLVYVMTIFDPAHAHWIII